MDIKTLKNTLIYNELSPSKSKDWFHYTRSKFINNVDTFYYSVSCAIDWENDFRVLDLVSKLSDLKKTAEDSCTVECQHKTVQNPAFLFGIKARVAFTDD